MRECTWLFLFILSSVPIQIPYVMFAYGVWIFIILHTLLYFIFFCAINFSLTLGILVFDSHCSCDFHTPRVFYSFLPCCPLPLKRVLLIACLRSLLCQSSIIVRYIYIHTLYSRTTILPPVLHVCAMLAYFEWFSFNAIQFFCSIWCCSISQRHPWPFVTDDGNG